MLPLQGFKELGNIFKLRTVPQAKEIVDATSGEKKNVVIIGTGFIGMEIAIALYKENDVNIIGMEKVPLYYNPLDLWLMVVREFLDRRLERYCRGCMS